MSKLEMECKCGETHMWQTMDPKPSIKFDVQDYEELLTLVNEAFAVEVLDSVLPGRDRPTTRMIYLSALESKLIAAKGKVTG